MYVGRHKLEVDVFGAEEFFENGRKRGVFVMLTQHLMALNLFPFLHLGALRLLPR